MRELARFQVPQRDGTVVAGRQRQLADPGTKATALTAPLWSSRRARRRGSSAADVPGHHGVVEGAGERASRSGVDGEGLDRPAMADEVARAGAPLLVHGAAVGLEKGAVLRNCRRRAQTADSEEADHQRRDEVAYSCNRCHPGQARSARAGTQGHDDHVFRAAPGSRIFARANSGMTGAASPRHSAGAMRAAAVSAAATSSIFSISRSAHRLWCSLAQLTST